MGAVKMNNVWDSIAKTVKIEGLYGELHLELDYKLCLHIYDDIMIMYDMILRLREHQYLMNALISRAGKWNTRYFYRIPNTAFRFRDPHIAYRVSGKQSFSQQPSTADRPVAPTLAVCGQCSLCIITKEWGRLQR